MTTKEVLLPDRQTDTLTDRRQTKWSLCAAMLHRRHKNGVYIWVEVSFYITDLIINIILLLCWSILESNKRKDFSLIHNWPLFSSWVWDEPVSQQLPRSTWPRPVTRSLQSPSGLLDPPSHCLKYNTEFSGLHLGSTKPLLEIIIYNTALVQLYHVFTQSLDKFISWILGICQFNMKPSIFYL